MKKVNKYKKYNTKEEEGLNLNYQSLANQNRRKRILPTPYKIITADHQLYKITLLTVTA